jgi:hypothetical protein
MIGQRAVESKSSYSQLFTRYSQRRLEKTKRSVDAKEVGVGNPEILRMEGMEAL